MEKLNLRLTIDQNNKNKKTNNKQYCLNVS